MIVFQPVGKKKKKRETYPLLCYRLKRPFLSATKTAAVGLLVESVLARVCVCVIYRYNLRWTMSSLRSGFVFKLFPVTLRSDK